MCGLRKKAALSVTKAPSSPAGFFYRLPQRPADWMPCSDQNQRMLSVIAHGQLLAYCPPQTTLKAPGKPTKPPVAILRQPGRA